MAAGIASVPLLITATLALVHACAATVDCEWDLLLTGNAGPLQFPRHTPTLIWPPIHFGCPLAAATAGAALVMATEPGLVVWREHHTPTLVPFQWGDPTVTLHVSTADDAGNGPPSPPSSSLGGLQALLRTGAGAVYAMGKNTYGNLGVGDVVDR